MENILDPESIAKITSMDGVDPVPVAARYDLSDVDLATHGRMLDLGQLLGHEPRQPRVSPAPGDALKRTGNHDPADRLSDPVRKRVEGEKSTE